MNGNPIFADQGPLPTFGHLTNSPADSLGPKDLEIDPDLVNRAQNQDSFPVILAGVASENISNQDGGSEDGDEREKVAHNLSCQKNCGDRLSDDILMFVGEGSSNDNNSSHTSSVNVALESPFLEGQNSVILPLDDELHLRGDQGHDEGRDSPVNLNHTADEQNPEVVASMALPAVVQHHDAVPMLITTSTCTSKSNSPKIDSLSINTSKMITIDSEAGNNHQRLATTLASMSTAGGGGGGSSVLDLGDSSGFSVRDLNLVGLPENAGIVNVIAGVNISPGEIVTSIPSPSTACLEPSTSENDNKTVCDEPTTELSVTAPLSNSTNTVPTIIDPHAVSILNPGQLELNVATIPASGASLGQPIMYIITSRDRNTGATQRFRVTVDAESVATAPIGSISLNTELPSLQIGSQWVVEQQSAVPVAGLVSGNILSTEGSPPAAGVVDGSGDNAAVNLNTQVVPSIEFKETESATTGLIKTELESGDSSVNFTTSYLQNKRNVKEEKVMCCTFEGCNQIFTTKKKLKLHQLIHADDRPHKCTVDGCDWTFPTLYKLRRHLAGHGGERPFHCDQCSAPFSTIYNLKMHRKRHERTELFVCDAKDCNRAFPTMIKLKNHLRIHFPERRIKCAYPGCNKSFTTTCGMGSHLRIHERNETSFPCLVEGCSKIYNKACRLKLHMRSHTGERPFKCTAEGCTWAFTCIQKLSRHMVQHTGDRKHVCDRPGCQKLFTRLEHLKTHLKTHTGEKPFACPEKDCNARFASRSSLYMHVRRHKEGYTAKQKPQFTCPMDDCDQSYSTKDGLKKHILTVHSVMLPSSSNESELVYIPTENPQAMVDAMTDPGLLQTPKVVRITQSDDSPSSNTANQNSPNAQKTDTATNTSTNHSQSNGPTPYTSVGLIVDTSGAPVNFINSPAKQEGAASSSGGAGGLHHENWSGSARTDFMYRPGGKKWKSTRNSESGESETDGPLSSSYIPTSFSMTTSASLTLRDPATGTRYVQTQLLQDDPPDESELAFQLTSHPTTPDPSSGDLNVSTILSVADPTGHSHCPSSSGVDFLQTDHETESSIGGFRESTINLQDLE